MNRLSNLELNNIIIDLIGDNICQHKRSIAKYDHRVCADCGVIKTDSMWKIAKNMWFNSYDDAKFYESHGRLPENSSSGKTIKHYSENIADAMELVKIMLTYNEDYSFEIKFNNGDYYVYINYDNDVFFSSADNTLERAICELYKEFHDFKVENEN